MKILKKELTRNLLKIFYQVFDNEEYFDLEILIEYEEDRKIINDIFGVRSVVKIGSGTIPSDIMYVVCSTSQFKELSRIQKYGYNYKNIINAKWLNRKLLRTLPNNNKQDKINKL